MHRTNTVQQDSYKIEIHLSSHLASFRTFINMVLPLILISLLIGQISSECVKSSTTATKENITMTNICSGDLLFEEDFNTFNLSIWTHRVYSPPQHFNEYVNDAKNSFVENGVLYVKPTLSGSTDWKKHKPIDSARVNTRDSFRFKFGKIEVTARVPAGDWIHSGIWMMPLGDYGGWPKSGEMDIMESRGNRDYFDKHGVHMGVERVGAALHFGLDSKPKPYRECIVKDKYSAKGHGFNQDFHRYQMEWSEKGIIYSVDDIKLNEIDVDEGFLKKGHFEKLIPPYKNIWENGTIMAPFDREFYIIFSNAVGGWYFNDEYINKNGKMPWVNGGNINNEIESFMKGQSQWLPTWIDNEPALQIDHIRVWAL